MGAVTVNDIIITPLTRVEVVGGDVLHGMRRFDPGYVDFGEAYFSLVDAGAIKAWKRHKNMTLNVVVPIGAVLFVFVDESNQVREELVGINRYVRLTVPPGIWFGFSGVYSTRSMLLNIADIPHDPKEVDRKSVDYFNYKWKFT